jgi:hypothetical protein
MCNIVRHKGDTISTVLEASPPNVTYMRDLIGPMLTFWNALLQHLAVVQLRQGNDEFRWNLHANGIFSVDSMYKALVQSPLLVHNNKKI